MIICAIYAKHRLLPCFSHPFGRTITTLVYSTHVVPMNYTSTLHAISLLCLIFCFFCLSSSHASHVAPYIAFSFPFHSTHQHVYSFWNWMRIHLLLLLVSLPRGSSLPLLRPRYSLHLTTYLPLVVSYQAHCGSPEKHSNTCPHSAIRCIFLRKNLSGVFWATGSYSLKRTPFSLDVCRHSDHWG